jgi:transcriptional regulator GlxA family with amidase domain
VENGQRVRGVRSEVTIEATMADAMRRTEGDAGTRRFVFVLLDQFTMLCFSSAVEALRIANRMSGKSLYAWTLVGEGGDIAWCSAGIGFKLDSDLDEVTRDDTVLVCGGIDVRAPRANV